MNKDKMERIKSRIAEILEVDKSRIIPAARIREDLGADSLDRYEMSYYLDSEFMIDVPDAEAAQIETVQDFIDWHDLKYGEGR